MNRINVCLSTDDNYVKYASNVILSALSNKNPDDEYKFYILHSSLSDESKKILESYDGVELCPVDSANYAPYFNNSACPHVALPTLYRLSLPSILSEVDRVLYLDCDTLILGDLSELFNTDLTNCYFAGVKDVWGVSKYVKRLNMKSPVYVNSGMLLFNCEYCRKEKFFDKIINFAKNNSKIIEFCDQDSINKVADENKVVLNPKYNLMDTWWRGGYYELEGEEEKEYLQAKDSPIIVHLTGLKPAFKGCENKFKDEWWKYAQKSLIYEELKKDYEESKEPSNKIAFYKKIFSIKNEYKGKTKTKVLTLLGIKIKLK